MISKKNNCAIVLGFEIVAIVVSHFGNLCSTHRHRQKKPLKEVVETCSVLAVSVILECSSGSLKIVNRSLEGSQTEVGVRPENLVRGFRTRCLVQNGQDSAEMFPDGCSSYQS